MIMKRYGLNGLYSKSLIIFTYFLEIFKVKNVSPILYSILIHIPSEGTPKCYRKKQNDYDFSRKLLK